MILFIFTFSLSSLRLHTHTHTHTFNFPNPSPTLVINKQRCVDTDQIDTYDGNSNILTEWPLDAANSENKKSMRKNHNASKWTVSYAQSGWINWEYTGDKPFDSELSAVES